MNPASSLPPGRSTRNDSRQTGSIPGRTGSRPGGTPGRSCAPPNALRSRMSPSTVVSSSPSRLATSPVLRQLPGRVVEHRDPRACRGEHRPLLAAAAGQAQHVQPGEVGREPVARDRLVPDQHDRPVPGPGRRDHLGPDRTVHSLPRVNLAVPGRPVMRCYGVRLGAHGRNVPGGPHCAAPGFRPASRAAGRSCSCWSRARTAFRPDR